MLNKQSLASNNTKKGIDPVTAGAIGIAIGAAIGAAAVELVSEDNRNALGKKLEEIGKEGEKVYSELSQKSEKISKKIASAKDDIVKKS